MWNVSARPSLSARKRVIAVIAIITAFLFQPSLSRAYSQNITGSYTGQLTQPGGPLVPVFAYSMTLTESQAGVVTGVTYSQAVGTPYFVIESLSGQVSNGIFTFQNGTILSQNPAPGTYWCLDSGQLTVGTNGGTLNGPWSASGCAPGTISVSASLGKLLGDSSTLPGGCNCGDPISLGNGNLFEQVTDYATNGSNQLSFSRYYNSLTDATTFAHALGGYWRSTFDRYLHVLSSSSVTAERATGQEVAFAKTSQAWTADSDVGLVLNQSGSGTGSTWTLTDSNDITETYTEIDAVRARLTSIRWRNGYIQELNYNSNNQLQQVSDSYGRALIFAYNGNLLQTVTTPDGLVVTYGYSSSGFTPGTNDRLATVSYSTTPTTSISYQYALTTFRFALTSIIDANGSTFATWTYDSSGRALTSQHGSGADLTTISYDDTTGNRTVTNALGQPSVYKFTQLQGIPKITEIDQQATSTTSAASRVFAYDGNGYLASQTDWDGNLTTFTNNSNGAPTAINEAMGSAAARTTNIAYDLTWIHLPAKITTAGLTYSFTYDSNGEQLTNTLADTTTTITPYSTSGLTRVWTNTWSNFLLASAQTPNGNTTRFSYDASGALSSITDPIGHLLQITAHSGGGLPETIVDPNGVTTTLAYDARQRLISKTVSGKSGTFKTTWLYDAAGNLITTALPDASYLTNTYDAAHRLVKVTDALGNYKSYTLDALGDRTQTSIYNKGGTLTWQESDTFDALGHKLVDTAGAGQTKTWTYDPNGNVLTGEDGLTHTTSNIYDALNRITASKDANGGVTSLTYDAHDRIVNVIDANGNATSYTRNGFGDVIQKTSPDSGATVFHYDGDANWISKTDAQGIVTNQTFDSLDRPLATTYPADAIENVAYTYDQTGGGFTFGIGRLTSVTDAAGSLTRAYEERGDLTSEVRTSGKTTLTTAYTYDGAGRVASMLYPDGTLVTYQRDVAGYLSTVAAQPAGSNTTTTLATLSHQPFGPENGITYGNGTSETRTYDSSYRVTNITDVLTGKGLQNLTYAYDNANNIKSVTDAINAANTQTFGYDLINRLANAVSGPNGYGSYSWTYDKVGNRLTQVSGPTTTAYGYAAGTNRLATISTLTVTARLDTLQFRNRNASSKVQLAGEVLRQKVIQSHELDKLPAASLATILGWPFLLGGIFAIIGFRKRLSHSQPLVILALFAILVGSATVLNGCGSSGGSKTTSSPIPVNTPAATPTLSLAPGTYTGVQTVTVSDSTSGATIYYTIDGSTPTSSSAQYTGPITVGQSETVQAFATASSYTSSPIASAAYIIDIVTNTSVTTNANGNITSIPPANSTSNAMFAYNNANRLASVTGSPMAATFVYDWAGQRYSKTDGGSPPTLYSYSPGGTLIAENDGGTVTDYIYADGRPIAVIQPTASVAADQVNYVVADRLGTPQNLVNSAGNTVWSNTDQPFGGTNSITSTVNQNLRLPGQIADNETGFNYNHFRDYMPNLGRYLETDPVGLFSGPNTYSYASQNPLEFIDFYGLADVCTPSLAGRLFERSLEVEYGLTTNADLMGFGGVNTVPDLYLAGEGIAEIKSGAYIYNSSQILAQIGIAETEGIPYYLLVSPTSTVAATTVAAADATGGGVVVYNSALGAESLSVYGTGAAEGGAALDGVLEFLALLAAAL